MLASTAYATGQLIGIAAMVAIVVAAVVDQVKKRSNKAED